MYLTRDGEPRFERQAESLQNQENYLSCQRGEERRGIPRVLVSLTGSGRHAEGRTTHALVRARSLRRRRRGFPWLDSSRSGHGSWPEEPLFSPCYLRVVSVLSVPSGNAPRHDIPSPVRCPPCAVPSVR